MNKKFDSTQFSGIVKPGEIFILVEKGYCIDEPDNLYTIRTDEEVVEALEMYVNIVCWEHWTFRSVLSMKMTSDDDHEIELLVYDTKFDNDVRLRLLLHKVKSFNEELVRMKEIFDFE
jgi:hypothetical protein